MHDGMKLTLSEGSEGVSLHSWCEFPGHEKAQLTFFSKNYGCSDLSVYSDILKTFPFKKIKFRTLKGYRQHLSRAFKDGGQ